jgi:hypothetical protein
VQQSDPTRDLVLQGEQSAGVAVEPLRPYVRVGFGVYQLSIHADLVPRPTDAPFEHIAYAQLLADLLRVNWLVPISECGITRDYEHVRDPRQIRGQIIGDTIHEVLLLRVVAEIGEGQHNN